MIDTLASIATLIAAIVVLGLGALATFAGTLMAVVAGPDDRPIEIPARTASIAVAMVGLVLFVAAITVIARMPA